MVSLHLRLCQLRVSDKEADKIVTFFNALEGRKPKIVYPQLPKSTAKTPKPQPTK